MKKGQTWSLDLLVAGGLFVLAFVLFFFVITQQARTTSVEDLRAEGELLSEKIIATSDKNIEEPAFIVGNEINKSLLKSVSDEDYNVLRSKLGIKGDFCIYILDSEGRLINISTITGDTDTKIGIGNAKANISGFDCG